MYDAAEVLSLDMDTRMKGRWIKPPKNDLERGNQEAYKTKFN